jgi:ubiquinone/menaquinone biosynthesis C-methylase UbiE
VAATGHSASFEKPAEAYDRFVGRYGRGLAKGLVEQLELERGWRALDVGCGPGPLTAVLAETLGADHVAAVDPSEPFARACAQRVPGADVRVASAEELPFPDGSFDMTVSQLVVNFLLDTLAGVRQMRRVTRAGGEIAASVWDYAGEMTMLRAFWDAAAEVNPAAASLDEGRRMRYSQPDALEELWSSAGLLDVSTGDIVVTARYADFDDLWSPFTLGVGPAGAHCASLSEPERERLRDAHRRRLGSPKGEFELSARAWFVRGRAPELAD